MLTSCPNCGQPVREQARFCNKCGTPLQWGSAPVGTAQATPAFASQPDSAPPFSGPAQPAMAQEMPAGKAQPTAPLVPAAPAFDAGATQPLAPQAPAAGDAAPTPTIGEYGSDLVPPPPPPPPAPGAAGAWLDPAATNPAGMGDGGAHLGTAATQEPAALPTPSEDLYPVTPPTLLNTPTEDAFDGPYAPLNAEPAIDNPGEAHDPGAFVDEEEVPTVRVRRPTASEVAVTSELLASLGAHTPLEPGMLLNGRYRVEEVIHTSEEENLYRVSDQRGYLRCWACNTAFPDNPETERFCSNCGADMLGREYWLREQEHAAPANAGEAATATDQGGADAGGAPGVNGAHLGEQANALAGGYIDANGEELDAPTQPTAPIDEFVIEPRQYRVEAIETDEPIFPVGVTLVAGARSDVGRTRRGNPNEDSILVMSFTRIHESISRPFGLYIVADGLGGHDDGQTASRLAIGEIASYMTREALLPAMKSGQFADGQTLASLLKAAVEAANLVLVGANERNHSDMGSTVTGALIVDDTAYIVNVGDSRTYLYDTVSLKQISIDHSLVQQLVAGGLIEREDIYTHPQRNQILRSLGDRRDIQIDLFEQKLKPNYQLIICCDGLWEMVHDPQIEQILRESSDTQTAADRLMVTANENGGEDNISVIVVQARE